MIIQSLEEGLKSLKFKTLFLIGFSLLFFFVLVFRLYHLQVVQGEHYRELAHQLTIRKHELRATRGLIFDRHKKPLVRSKNIYDVVVIPQYMGDIKLLSQSLAKLLEEKPQKVLRQLKKAKRKAAFQPVTLAKDISFKKLAIISQNSKPRYQITDPFYLKGVEVRQRIGRVYLYPEAFSHVLGFLNEVDGPTLKAFQKKHPNRLSLGDYKGASGLEEIYDLSLRGFDGHQAQIVDAKGYAIPMDEELQSLKERFFQPTTAGQAIITTLDFATQQAAFLAMQKYQGAALVALNPQNGEVIALVSHPGFNPNLVHQPGYYKEMMANRAEFNRALFGVYPPGSTFKMVTALAALENKTINPKTSFACRGGVHFGRLFKCWNRGGHGQVNLTKALAQSCNSFFYQLGIKLDIDQIATTGEKLFLTKKTGVDLAGENAGFIPTKHWAKTSTRRSFAWQKGETLSVAIGQGDVRVNPLANAVMISIIANGGYSITPHLIHSFVDTDGKIIPQKTPQRKKLFLKEDILAIQKGLVDVVHGHGTARRLKKSPNKIAGKTGTAQVIGHDSKAKKGQNTKPHGWFVAYAPYDNPQIAVAVFVEHGGGGSVSAAPIAQIVIDTYLEQKAPKP